MIKKKSEIPMKYCILKNKEMNWINQYPDLFFFIYKNREYKKGSGY